MTRTGAYKVEEAQKRSPKSLGDRIKRVRTAWGWSQDRLAQELNVPQQSVSCWERDQHPPVGSAMASLVRLFGLPERALVEGIGFLVPAKPDQVRPGLRVTEGSAFGGDLNLPSGRPNKAWMLSLVDDEASAEAIPEAVKRLKKAAQDGRSVWVLIR